MGRIELSSFFAKQTHFPEVDNRNRDFRPFGGRFCRFEPFKVAASPDSDELYDQMIARCDRLREEVEKQIKTVDVTPCVYRGLPESRSKNSSARTMMKAKT
jgi:hypothetical protein